VREIKYIPQELSEFLGEPGASLLIRGALGSGKTILALSLMRYLSSGGGGKRLFFRLDKSLSGEALQECSMDKGIRRGESHT